MLTSSVFKIAWISAGNLKIALAFSLAKCGFSRSASFARMSAVCVSHSASFVWWYFRVPRERSAARNLPTIVGLSLLLAPYGVWQHDLVLLLVPILATGVKLAKTPHTLARSFGVGSLVLANAAMLTMMVDHASSEWYVWVTPAILLGCWGSVRLADCSPATASVPLVAGA